MRTLLLATVLIPSLATAAVPTPPRPLTDPQSLSSPANPAARPVPLPDLIYTRSIGSAAWSADGKQLFLVTNFTGRQNIWRVDAGGSWPVQMTQSDDSQGDLAIGPDGTLLYFAQDTGGNELHDIYAVPTAGGAVRNVTASDDADEQGLLGGSGGIAFSSKRKGSGQFNLGLLDKATGKARLLTSEADPQWSWSAVAWIDGGKALIANRTKVGGDEAQIWRVNVADGKATQLAATPGKLVLANGATADGRILAGTSNVETGQARAGLFDTATGQWRWLPATAWEQEAVAMSPDGTRMLIADNVDGRQSLALVDVASLATVPVALPPGLNTTPAGQPFTSDGRRLLVAHAGADTPSELFVADLAAGTATPLTHMAMASLDPANLAKSQVVTYKSFDGTLISAVVTVPFNLKRDGSNPAIVVPHGGPTGQSRDNFSRQNAALAVARLYRHRAEFPRLDRLWRGLPEGQFQGSGRRRPEGRDRRQGLPGGNGLCRSQARRHHRRVVWRVHDADGDRQGARCLCRRRAAIWHHQLADDVPRRGRLSAGLSAHAARQARRVQGRL